MIRTQLSTILRNNLRNESCILQQLSQRTISNGTFAVQQGERRKVSQFAGILSKIGAANVSGLLQGCMRNSTISQPARKFHLLNQFDSHTMSRLFQPKYTVDQEAPKRTLVIQGFKGRRKTVRAIIDRFYRLQWGIWIRPRSGRHRKLYRKRENLKRWSRYHVFCNATQSTMFDKMVAKFWRRKKYYVDDPYEPYHTRPDFPITSRRGLK